MSDFKVIEIKKNVLEDNEREADALRGELKERGIFLLNLMSSPGSGKTTTLLRTIEALREEIGIGVMEADIDSDVDAEAVAAAGVKAVQIHTGGMCHLDADMTRQGIESLGTEGVELAVLENVGNLVCPAEFDTGAVKNAMILSVPEGDDKPLKYPLMFSVCDVLLINKIDVLPYFRYRSVQCAGKKIKPGYPDYSDLRPDGRGDGSVVRVALHAGKAVERVRVRRGECYGRSERTDYQIRTDDHRPHRGEGDRE